MPIMSPELALKLFADDIPFLQENSLFKLPYIKPNSDFPHPIDDIFIVLGLLLERHNDSTRRRILKDNCTRNRHKKRVHIVRVDVCRSGYMGNEWTRCYDFPITNRVFDELVRERYVEGEPSSIVARDYTEFSLAENGILALLKHIKTL